MKTDSLFYKLFNYAPSLLFDLVDLQIADTTGYQFRSEEIKQTAFRIDGLFVPAAENKAQPLVFVEVQFQPDEDFYSRFFSELFLYLRYQKPQHAWQAVVIYPDRSIEKHDSYQHYQLLLNSPQVHRVYLEDLEQLDADTIGLQLIQLIVAKQSHAIAKAQTLVNQVQQFDSKQQLLRVLDIIEAIMVCKLPHLNREEIQKMLDFIELDIKKTQFYQDVVAENKQEWIEKGKEQGRAQGQLDLILRLCKHRYGKLTVKTMTQLKNLSLNQLDNLALLLIEDSDNFDAEHFKTWLKTQYMH
jgi:predicted transposase/invertase (TIGR01784 family)